MATMTIHIVYAGTQYTEVDGSTAVSGDGHMYFEISD